MVSGRADAESGDSGARPIRILMLTASPQPLEQTRVHREVRLIQEKLRASAHRSRVELIPRLAVRVDDLLQALLEVEPDVVHFSGHGTEESEIILEDNDGYERPIRKEALADLFGVLKDRIRVVVLNACYSRDQAEAISEHVDCTIGMSDAMPDAAAIEFAAAFYQAVGFGRSVQTAFDLGVKALELKGIDGATVPELVLQKGADAREIVLIGGASPRASTALGKLVNVPELPPNFLPRPGDLDRLKALVLGGSSKSVGLTGRTLRAGVHGMGGIGKSVLAAGLARDTDVRRTFRDGVLWITLGRDPKLTLLQSELCGYLGERGAAFEHEAQGRARLTEHYRDRACLVVLDDVWDARHAAAFGELGPDGRFLLTTRDAGIVVSLGAEACSLDVLGVDESLALLAGWSGQPVSALPDEAREVARECGYLPLALAMVGAMVRGRAGRWGNALHKLRTADLVAIRRSFPDYAYPDLLRAIEVSLDALDPSQRERYLDFAVFAEDTPVPEAVLATLWKPEGLDAYAAQDLLDTFVDRSLLRRDEDGRLRLHDLQYDYVRTRAGDLARLHGRLVDAYRAACPNGWASGPNDRYFFLHLPTHLAAAGRTDDLRKLLLDYAWLSAKLEATDPAALLTDYGIFPTGDAPRLIEGALRLSAHVLAVDRDQLSPQLLGRLLDEENEDVQTLMASASRTLVPPRIRPLTASLTHPGGPLRCTFAGHAREVWAVAVTPDGRHAISGSSDGALKMWELLTAREVRSFAGHASGVRALAVTPDGLYAISASQDKTLKVWDLATGREVRTLAGHSSAVGAVAATQDGCFVISGSSDSTLKVWDLSTGRDVRTLVGHMGGIRAVAVTQDGRHAVSASEDWTLSVWEIETGRRARVFAGHSSGMAAVAVTPDGRHVISGGDTEVKLWELATGREVRTLAQGSIKVAAIAVTPNGRYAISGSFDGTLKMWELATGREVWTLSGHASWVWAVAVTPDGRHAVSASDDDTLKVWEIETGRGARSAEHARWVRAVAVTPDGRHAVSGSSATLKLWELTTGVRVRTLCRRAGRVVSMAITPDGRHVVSGSADATLTVWELATGLKVRTLSGHGDWIWAVAVTPDGRHVVSGSEDDTLKVWDLEAGREVRALKGHRRRVCAVAVTPNGRRIVSGSDDGTLKVWELETGREVRSLSGHASGVWTVAITPDGRRAISGSYDKTLKTWELETGREVRSLVGHLRTVQAVAITPDGRYAVSGSEDRTLRTWNLRTGAPAATFQGDHPFLALAIAPDGQTIVAGDSGGRVHFLRLEGLP